MSAHAEHTPAERLTLVPDAPEAPACPVHPYGYHAGPRVRPAGERRVFRDRSPLGLPARCSRLEDELHEADRELDFIDELWVAAREGRARALGFGAAALTAVGVAAGAAAGAEAATLWWAGVGGAAAAVALDRVDAAFQRARLRRIRDWHKRVGTPV